jgi:hypothetical protein
MKEITYMALTAHDIRKGLQDQEFEFLRPSQAAPVSEKLPHVECRVEVEAARGALATPDDDALVDGMTKSLQSKGLLKAGTPYTSGETVAMYLKWALKKWMGIEDHHGLEWLLTALRDLRTGKATNARGQVWEYTSLVNEMYQLLRTRRMKSWPRMDGLAEDRREAAIAATLDERHLGSSHMDEVLRRIVDNE